MDLFDYKPHETIKKPSKLEITEIFNGKSELLLTVYVLSMYTEEARNAATVRDKIVADDKATEEEKETANAEYIASLCSDWVIPEGHTLGGRRPKFSREEAVNAAKKWPLFNSSVLRHSATLTNWGEEAKKS